MTNEYVITVMGSSFTESVEEAVREFAQEYMKGGLDPLAAHGDLDVSVERYDCGVLKEKHSVECSYEDDEEVYIGVYPLEINSSTVTKPEEEEEKPDEDTFRKLDIDW